MAVSLRGSCRPGEGTVMASMGTLSRPMAHVPAKVYCGVVPWGGWGMRWDKR